MRRFIGANHRASLSAANRPAPADDGWKRNLQIGSLIQSINAVTCSVHWIHHILIWSTEVTCSEPTKSSLTQSIEAVIHSVLCRLLSIFFRTLSSPQATKVIQSTVISSVHKCYSVHCHLLSPQMLFSPLSTPQSTNVIQSTVISSVHKCYSVHFHLLSPQMLFSPLSSPPLPCSCSIYSSNCLAIAQSTAVTFLLLPSLQ